MLKRMMWAFLFFSILFLTMLFALIYPLSHKKPPTHGGFSVEVHTDSFLFFGFELRPLSELFMGLFFPGLPAGKFHLNFFLCGAPI